jgi:hypothetical protein
MKEKEAAGDRRWRRGASGTCDLIVLLQNLARKSIREGAGERGKRLGGEWRGGVLRWCRIWPEIPAGWRHFVEGFLWPGGFSGEAGKRRHERGSWALYSRVFRAEGVRVLVAEEIGRLGLIPCVGGALPRCRRRS